MLLFTVHAVERYIDFHCIGKPMTMEDARILLELHADKGIKQHGRTIRGDDVWAIHALGIELVARHGSLRGVVGDVCVTILPPPVFRGLSPLQAERVAGLLSNLDEQERDLRREESALVDPPKVEINPTDPPEVKATKQAARTTRNEILFIHQQRRTELKLELAILTRQREILAPMLKTMRHAISTQRNAVATSEPVFVAECRALAHAVAVLIGDCAIGTAMELLVAFGMSDEDAERAIQRCREGYWMDNANALQGARLARRR